MSYKSQISIGTEHIADGNHATLLQYIAMPLCNQVGPVQDKTAERSEGKKQG
jgi:hypothetical protein